MLITPESKPPDCPDHLHGQAQEIWIALARRLVACRIYTLLDECALELLCRSFAQYLETLDELAALDSGHEAARPTLRVALEEIASQAHRQARSMAAQFFLIDARRLAIFPVDADGRDAELMALLDG